MFTGQRDSRGAVLVHGEVKLDLGGKLEILC